MNKEVAVEEGPRWEGLHPEILALIFSKIPPIELVRCLPWVCKSWMEVVAGPYCWEDIDIQAWCRRRNDSRAVDQVVKKLIPRSKLLEIPMSRVTDHMILMHMKSMPNLNVLDINFCYNITAKGIAAFGNQCKSLVHLKRNVPPAHERCCRIDDSEAKTIADTMPNLQRVELCFSAHAHTYQPYTLA
ncbi:hypothetical protein L2E82_11884 [Cichorium intybus]|uniref:Uncharacterized protein n=1 Tax=Cichorium intybus TaxID=13427 RepID=A0ACB9GGI5_CICIN|nr:hypothetical protein L2E82_11884 [Cichorium intybus]